MSNNELNVLLARLESLLSQTRQYVGARYVPRFTGLFDITQSYEALDVVDNGSGTSYIAKKPTPAGTPLTDTNYWFLYGSTNGAIVNLQRQINDMKDGTIPGSLQDQINDNASDITALKPIAKNALNTNFATRKVVFLGDSYNYSSGGWLSTLVAKLGISSSNYYDYTASGHSFNSDGWKNDITAFVTDHSDIKDEITDIIIVGGVNDATDSALARVENDITNFLSYVSTNMPNAYTTVAFVGGATQQSSVLNGRTYKNRMSAFYKYRAQLTTAKSRLLAGTYNALCDPSLFDTDGLHPNAYGNLAIAQMVAMALTSGNCNMIHDDGVNSASYVFNVRSGINNDYAYVHIDSAMLENQTTIPANGSSSKLELSMPLACRVVNAPPILTKLKVANNTSYDVKAWIENAKLCIQSCELANNTWASITTPSLGSFLMDMHFTKPTNDV